jgi:hypothetical protein
MLHSLNQLAAQFRSKHKVIPATGRSTLGHLQSHRSAARGHGDCRQLTVLTQPLDMAAPAVRAEMQGFIDNGIRKVLPMVAALILGTFSLAVAYRAIVLHMQRHDG